MPLSIDPNSSLLLLPLDFNDCPQGSPLWLSEINHTSYCPRNRGVWLGTLSLSFPELIKLKIFCLFFPLALS